MGLATETKEDGRAQTFAATRLLSDALLKTGPLSFWHGPCTFCEQVRARDGW
jgi:hypothetical protein